MTNALSVLRIKWRWIVCNVFLGFISKTWYFVGDFASFKISLQIETVNFNILASRSCYFAHTHSPERSQFSQDLSCPLIQHAQCALCIKYPYYAKGNTQQAKNVFSLSSHLFIFYDIPNCSFSDPTLVSWCPLQSVSRMQHTKIPIPNKQFIKNHFFPLVIVSFRLNFDSRYGNYIHTCVKVSHFIKCDGKSWCATSVNAHRTKTDLNKLSMGRPYTWPLYMNSSIIDYLVVARAQQREIEIDGRK